MGYLTYAALAFWLLWVFFLAVMNLKQTLDEGRLTGFPLLMGYLTYGAGLVIDFVVQVGPASLLWLELPREWTVSRRVSRLCREGHGYRYNLAFWFQQHMLAPFDRSGGHGAVQRDTSSNT